MLCLWLPPTSADFTHVISLGPNDLFQAFEAVARFALGGAGYQDPVDSELLFAIDPVTGLPVLDDSGQPVPNFEPVIEVRLTHSRLVRASARIRLQARAACCSP